MLRRLSAFSISASTSSGSLPSATRSRTLGPQARRSKCCVQKAPTPARAWATTLPTPGNLLATAAPQTPVSGSTAAIENVAIRSPPGARPPGAGRSGPFSPSPKQSHQRARKHRPHDVLLLLRPQSSLGGFAQFAASQIVIPPPPALGNEAPHLPSILLSGTFFDAAGHIDRIGPHAPHRLADILRRQAAGKNDRHARIEADQYVPRRRRSGAAELTRDMGVEKHSRRQLAFTAAALQVAVDLSQALFAGYAEGGNETIRFRGTRRQRIAVKLDRTYAVQGANRRDHVGE